MRIAAPRLRLDDMHIRNSKWTMMGAYARSKLAVMLWGLELDRRLRAANSPVVSQLTHPGWVASNLSNVSDKPFMAAADRVVQKGGERGRQRHRCGRRADVVLHQRAGATGQLHRLRRSVRFVGSAGDARPHRASPATTMRPRVFSSSPKRKPAQHFPSSGLTPASRRRPAARARPPRCPAPVPRPATGAARPCPAARRRWWRA